MIVSKRDLLFQGTIFRLHLRLQGCKSICFIENEKLGFWIKPICRTKINITFKKNSFIFWIQYYLWLETNSKEKSWLKPSHEPIHPALSRSSETGTPLIKTGASGLTGLLTSDSWRCGRCLLHFSCWWLNQPNWKILFIFEILHHLGCIKPCK